MKLTNTSIEKLQATHRGKGLISDDACDQLYIKVGKTGAASWVRIAQGGGKRTEKVIGHFPNLSLEEARARMAVNTGVARARGDITIGAAVEEYLAERAKTLKRKSLADSRRYLTQYLHALQNRPLEAFTSDAIKSIVQDQIAGKPGAANRLFANCKTFSAWCADKKPPWLDPNPLALPTRKKFSLPAENERERTLTDEEVRTLMAQEGQIARVLQFALLTGARIGEVIQLADHPEQIDTEHWWTLPAAIRKVKRSHRVYLSPLARKVYGDGLWYYSYAACYAWAKRGDEPAAWNIHDLRRTAATLMQDAGVRFDVVARCLGQKLGGSLVRIYQRGEQRAAVKEAFEVLGKQVSKIAK